MGGIVRGRVSLIDTALAEALKGVVKVYTHLNAPKRIPTPYTQNGGYVSDTNMPLTGPEIHNDGQMIAMIVAESYEVARDASHRVVVRYEAATPAATMDSPGAESLHPDTLADAQSFGRPRDLVHGLVPNRRDVDQHCRPHHVELHQADQRRAAAFELHRRGHMRVARHRSEHHSGRSIVGCFIDEEPLPFPSISSFAC